MKIKLRIKRRSSEPLIKLPAPCSICNEMRESWELWTASKERICMRCRSIHRDAIKPGFAWRDLTQLSLAWTALKHLEAASARR